MKKLLSLLVVALAIGCKPTAHKMAALPTAPPIFQVIPAGADPNVLKIPGAQGTVLQNSGGHGSWVMDSTGTWVTNPPAGGGGTVSSAISPLQILDGGAIQIADGGIQNPNNVAITGGSITGVNTATRSVQGAMSAADKAFLLDTTSWQQTQYATVIADVPAVTRFKCGALPPPVLGAEGAFTGDGTVEGGGASATNTTFVVGASIFQNTPGGNWALCYRAKFPANAASVNSQIGIESTTGPGTDSVWVGVNNALDATHWVGRIVAGVSNTLISTTTASDTSWHDFCITDNATTIRERVDGTLVGSTATRSNLVATAMKSYIFASSGVTVSATDRCYGYVAP